MAFPIVNTTQYTGLATQDKDNYYHWIYQNTVSELILEFHYYLIKLKLILVLNLEEKEF